MLKLKPVRITPRIIKTSVIGVMCIVIIILTSVYLAKVSKASGSAGDPEKPAYIYKELPRMASLSLDPQLLAENYIDGEESVSVDKIMLLIINKKNLYYIFGSTTSKERDFERTDTNRVVYLCRANDSGTVLSMTFFGGSGTNTFTDVKNIGTGFAVLVNSDSNDGDYFIYKLDYEGRLINTYPLGTTKTEQSVTMQYYNSKLTIVTVITDQLTRRKELLIDILSNDFNTRYSKRIYRTASMDFCSLFVFPSRYVVFATATQGASVFPTMISFTETGDPEFDDFNDTLPDTVLCDAVISPEGGYLMGVISKNTENKAKIIYYKNVPAVIYEGPTDAAECKFFDCGNFYFRIKCVSDGEDSYSVAVLNKKNVVLSSNFTRLSNNKRLINVYQGASPSYVYAVLENAGKTEVIGLNDTFAIKLDGVPRGIILIDGGMAIFSVRERPYISFADYLFPEALS